MSFVLVKPFAPTASQKVAAAVTVSLHVPEGKGAARVRILLRASAIGKLPWLVGKTAVSFAVGDGEHAGKARISKGGDFRLLVSGGGNSGTTERPVLLIVPPFGDVVLKPHAPVICDFRLDADGGIIIDLPTFLRASARPGASTIVGPAQKPFAIGGPSHEQTHAGRLAAAERGRSVVS